MTTFDPAVDPVSFAQWAVWAVGGEPVDDGVEDAGIDGLIVTGQGRVLVAVKGGDAHPRVVGDLARAVEVLDATGAVLVCRTSPPRAVYEAAACTGSTSSVETDGVAVVQILTAAEVLDGKRPDGTLA